MNENQYIHPEAAVVISDLVHQKLLTVDEGRQFLGYKPFGLPETSRLLPATDDHIDPGVKAASREIFEGRVEGKTACHHCGGLHGWVAGLQPWEQPCPRLKRVIRTPDGIVTEAEYWPPGEWERGIIFPDDVFDEDD